MPENLQENGEMPAARLNGLWDIRVNDELTLYHGRKELETRHDQTALTFSTSFHDRLKSNIEYPNGSQDRLFPAKELLRLHIILRGVPVVESGSINRGGRKIKMIRTTRLEGSY